MILYVLVHNNWNPLPSLSPPCYLLIAGSITLYLEVHSQMHKLNNIVQNITWTFHLIKMLLLLCFFFPCHINCSTIAWRFLSPDPNQSLTCTPPPSRPPDPLKSSYVETSQQSYVQKNVLMSVSREFYLMEKSPFDPPQRRGSENHPPSVPSREQNGYYHTHTHTHTLGDSEGSECFGRMFLSSCLGNNNKAHGTTQMVSF